MGLNPQAEKYKYDLGWLIQNDQISDSDLSRVLLDDYSQNLYLLAYALKDPAFATSVEKTLVKVLTNRHKYQNDIPGRAWLYTCLIQESLKPRRPEYARRLQNAFSLGFLPASHAADLLRPLDPLHALVAFFQLALGLTPEEIAAAAQIPQSQVETLLHDFHQQVRQHHQTCPTCIAQFSTLAELEESLSQEFHSISIPTLPSTTNNGSVFQRAAVQKKQRGIRTRMLQFAQAGLLALVVLLIGWAATRPTPALPAQASITDRLIPTRPQDYGHEGRVFTVKPEQTPTPDDLHPDVSKIVDLAMGNQREWHTVWLDIQVTRYNSHGFDSLPQAVSRTQAWIDQPSHARVIYGSATLGPTVTYAIVDHEISGQNFQNGQTFHQNTSDLISDPDLQRLLDPQRMFPLNGSFTLVGRGIISGKPSWIVDWTTGGTYRIRVWISAQYGIILRRQEFGGDGFTNMVSDTLVNSVAFDARFPDTLFDLGTYHGDRFAYDFSGAPEVTGNLVSLASWIAPENNAHIQAQSDAPTNLSLAHSRLEFFNLHAGYGYAPQWVVYADHYLLGQLPMGGSALLSCQRTLDGKKIAYNSVVQNGTGDTALYEADLSDIQNARLVLPTGITSGDYAFAPDSRRLAFYGCDQVSGFCGIFILDTRTHALSHLIGLSYADYLLWSPDGKQLAFVGREDSSAIVEQRSKQNMLMNELIALSQNWHFYVVDTTTDKLQYKRSFEWSDLKAPDDSPTLAWGTAFKPPSSGSAPCIDQPG
jgi:DNA-directed RNA polymerase specialized sigma24 family protein